VNGVARITRLRWSSTTTSSIDIQLIEVAQTKTPDGRNHPAF
jgi:hypothetical protein